MNEKILLEKEEKEKKFIQELENFREDLESSIASIQSEIEDCYDVITELEDKMAMALQMQETVRIWISDFNDAAEVKI